MRKLRFRAWDGKSMKLAFDLSQNPKYWWEENKDYPLMQYSGVKDSEGIDIYEGDIVKGYFEDLGEEIGLVVFKQGFQIEIEGIENLDDVSGWLEHAKKIEIIGNIYENPDLI